MILTKIGIALAAILAIAAFAASTAAAEFTSSGSPVALFGEQKTGGNHTFKVDGQAVECNKAVFEKASLTTPAKTVPGVTAAYSECTAFGFANATVKMESCTYEFLQTSAEFKSNVAVRCTGTPAFVQSSIFGSTCKVTIGESENTNLSELKYQNNNPSAGKVLVTANVGGITVNKVTDSGLCPLSGTGIVHNSTYTGPTPVEGVGGVSISVD